MYVVTGGAGFIGSNILAALETRTDRKIVVCDRLRDGDKWRNVAKRDLTDVVHPDDLFDFLVNNASNIKAVIHMGAISSTTETDADKIFENNFRLSMDLWRWCTGQHVPFIYASSAATYGGGEYGFEDVEDGKGLSKFRPLNPYGWSKHLFDRRIARMIKDGDPHPPQWVGLKFFNVYGPNEYHKGGQKSVVAHVYPDAKKGKEATLFKSHNKAYKDGGQLRDFVWIGDCVDLVLWFLENPDVSGLFNCGTGTARSFADLATAVFAALGKKAQIKYVPTPMAIRDKYQYFTEADMKKLRAAGYKKTFTPLEDGVAKYVQGYLDAEDPYI